MLGRVERYARFSPAKAAFHKGDIQLLTIAIAFLRQAGFAMSPLDVQGSQKCFTFSRRDYNQSVARDFDISHSPAYILPRHTQGEQR